MLPLSSITFAQEVKYQLSSHILDINQGAPAPNVRIGLEKMDKNKNWVFVDEKHTDENGRIKDFLKEEEGTNHQGIYKLTLFFRALF
jgi:5-hydroxyisourate hydrolase